MFREELDHIIILHLNIMSHTVVKRGYQFTHSSKSQIISTHKTSTSSGVDHRLIEWRPLIIIADNVINRLFLSKSVVPKHSI